VIKNRMLLLPLLFFSALSQVANSQTLPVELVYFYGQQEDNNIALFWGTATELNNYGFFIERSQSDSLNFIEVGFILGHGTSYSPKDYIFTDTSVTQPDIYYFRLKQMDTNGAIKYSWIISVNLLTSVEEERLPVYESELKIYPNPFNSQTIVSFSSPINERGSLRIYDANGKFIQSIFDGIIEKGENKIVVDLNNFASGNYFLNLRVKKRNITKRIIHLK